jgi:cellulose synthase/poly-beta-1,6-N-acetylglucosamine synthase-like glycosyltransferase
MPPFVSVIVPCRNEAGFLPHCLDSILGSDYPAHRMEVLVADGRSEDGSRALIEAYAARDARVRRVDNPQRVTPAALNRGIETSRGDIVMRLDAHATIAPDYIRSAVEALRVWKADNVGGAMKTCPRSPGLFAEPIRIVLTHRFGVGNSRFRTGAREPEWVDTVFAGCWPREVFERVGLFNEKLERSQDMEFSQRLRRAGGKILLVPSIESRYYARSTLASFWRHNWANGVWAVLPMAYCDALPVRLRHLIPLAFVASLAASAFARVPLLVAGPYIVANLACSIGAAARQRDLTLAWRLPIVFAALHLAYGTGSLWGALRVLFAKLRRQA